MYKAVKNIFFAFIAITPPLCQGVSHSQTIELEPIVVYGVSGTSATAVRLKDGTSKLVNVSIPAVWKTFEKGAGLTIDINYAKGSTNTTGPSRDQIDNIIDGINLLEKGGEMSVSIVYPADEMSKHERSLASRRLNSLLTTFKTELGGRVTIVEGRASSAKGNGYVGTGTSDTLRFKLHTSSPSPRTVQTTRR